MRDLILVGLACLFLEPVLRTFRVPIFALQVPLLLVLWGALEPRRLLFGATWFGLAAGVTWWLLGPASLDFTLAFAVAVPLVAFRGRPGLARWARGWRLVLLLGLAWSLLSLCSGHFPTGSLAFEAFFTAVLTQVVVLQEVSAFLSRCLLAGLTVLSAHLVGRWVGSWRPAGWILLIVGVVSVPLATATSPAPAAASAPTRFEPLAAEEVVEPFAESPASVSRHPVLPQASRTRQVCEACHANKTAGSALPRAEKDMHEIHFHIEEIDRECTFCHEGAGLQGFPDLLAEGDRRAAYNRRCSTCHMDPRDGNGRLSWRGVYR